MNSKGAQISRNFPDIKLKLREICQNKYRRTNCLKPNRSVNQIQINPCSEQKMNKPLKQSPVNLTGLSRSLKTWEFKLKVLSWKFCVPVDLLIDMQRIFDWVIVKIFVVCIWNCPTISGFKLGIPPKDHWPHNRQCVETTLTGEPVHPIQPVSTSLHQSSPVRRTMGLHLKRSLSFLKLYANVSKFFKLTLSGKSCRGRDASSITATAL